MREEELLELVWVVGASYRRVEVSLVRSERLGVAYIATALMPSADAAAKARLMLSGMTACMRARAEGERGLGEVYSVQRCRGEEEDNGKVTTAAGIPGRHAHRRGKRGGGGAQRGHADAGEWEQLRGHDAVARARRLGGGRRTRSPERAFSASDRVVTTCTGACGAVWPMK